ncbi:MAG: tRNA (adenosine(37)-N6)-threonylcarbamoyltransferase complex dimerization subunit type 1 TsaB [Oscillospiraceae bacterium]|nr:tRNA (adenosine(37)-N6)-threonylcarbamoyltransferase complex dimerization subunit type 1 TsaB [Oscillospiraceae bacterium]
MKLIAFESSAKAASAALLEDGRLVGESYLNNGLTHSRTLLKLAQDLLENCGWKPADVDAAAYANGPGSFTGIRIGVAAAKGFCWGMELPCVPVSTLEAMAYARLDLTGTVCCCMDARRDQVYNAVFSVTDRGPVRLRDDRAISIAELAEDLQTFPGDIYLVGDGAALVYEALGGQIPGLHLTAEHLRQQRASGVALAAWETAKAGKAVSAALPLPNYLRLSQAERERLARLQSKEKGE